MSLVGYDESSSEEELEECVPDTRVGMQDQMPGARSGATSNMPMSRTASGTVRIPAPAIPVLASGDSDDEDLVPDKRNLMHARSRVQRSGLLTKLPAPMNATRLESSAGITFFPYVLSNRKRKNSADRNGTEGQNSDVKADENKGASCTSYVPSIAEVKKRSAEAAKRLLLESKAQSLESNDSDQEISNSNFFSFCEAVPEVDAKEAVERTIADDVAPNENDGNDALFHVSSDTTTHETSEGIIHEERKLLRLQGKRNRHEDMTFIDIRADDALAGSKEILLKQISEEKDGNISHKKHNVPGGMMKKKHQLPYLIEQARAREVELKNTWAQNRLSKQQTQSKYGW